MILIIIFLVAIIAAGIGAVGGVVLDRATRPALAAASPTSPQKMICPYDGLEVTGDNEIDKAVHMQCINMTHFILEQEVEKRATALAQQKVKELPPPPKWEIKLTNNDRMQSGDYPFRWTVYRDGVKRDTGTARSEGKAEREGNARMLDLQRQDK